MEIMIRSSDANLPGHNFGDFHHAGKMFGEITEGLHVGMGENSPDFSGGSPPYPCASHKRSSHSDICSGVYCQNKGMIGMDHYDYDSVCMRAIEALLDDTEQEYETGEAILDIDANDKSDPYAAFEYIDDLYAYYKEAEVYGLVRDYMPQQPDLDKSMRAILIDWLIEAHDAYKLKEEALYLTVNLVDRFLALQPTQRTKLQLVGITALLLACKYEGSRLAIDDLLFMAAGTYTREELLESEEQMSDALEFDLSFPTTYVFMMRFLKAAESNKQMEDLSFFLLDLCLVEYDMLRFPPSLLAAAAVYTAQCTLYRSKTWTNTCKKYTTYSVDQLLECSRKMVNLHKKTGTAELQGVIRKYSSYRYNYVAEIFEPAEFLLF